MAGWERGETQAVSMGSFPVNLFSRVGIALWGRDNAAWAQELGIAERTIRRYENGDMEPPRGGLAGIADPRPACARYVGLLSY